MTAAALVADLEARGVRLAEKARGQLAVSPPAALRPDEVEALRTSKDSVLAYLRDRRRLKAETIDWRRVSLYDLRQVLEVAVPWSDVRLLIAPGCRKARELRNRDPKPSRVWCTCEVLDLLFTNVPPEDAQKIAEANLLLDGTLAGVLTEGEHHPGNSEGES